ncbi:FCD domain-containing protein [Tessaracoccus sp. HDW20]|uniref:FCD domain-containing protein n=1 Tax=Tessaracoccus coleopterorum TaxID=2714950 RepID=UPI0018D36AD5|nr:FCD domain-containing protein [Tessaracoccus coleopterorum]
MTGAIREANPELVATLREALGYMLTAAEEDDLPGFIDGDVTFHRAVWAASGNELLPRCGSRSSPPCAT